MIDIRIIPAPAPGADVRLLAEVERRRAWARQWVGSWWFRRRAENLGAAFGMFGPAAVDAMEDVMRFAMAAEAAGLRDAEGDRVAQAELTAIWDDS